MYYTKKFIFIAIIFISFLYAADASAGIIVRPAMNNGLVGYWNFDVGKGHSTAYDMSGNRNHGTLTNMDPATDWVDSATTTGRLLGQALDFDGSNDYVNIDTVANDFSTNSDLTASLWIKANNNHTLANSKKGCFISFHSSTGANKGPILCIGDQTASANNNELMVYDGTSEAWEITTNTVIGDNTWHHIVYIRSGATGDVYIDTINKGSHTPNWTHASNDKWSVSQEWDNGTASDFTDGLIDEVRIYNRALSAGEIQRLYNLSRPKFSAPDNTGLVGYWSFNEGTGTVAGDASGQGNNGTLTNGPTRAIGKLGQALSFDGSNDYVAISNTASLKGLSAASISLWYKPRANPSANAGIYYESTTATGYTRFAVFHNANGDLSAVMRDTNSGAGFVATETGGAGSNLNKWIHVAVTVNAGDDNLLLYRNGVQVASNTAAKGAFTTGNPANVIAIGSFSGAAASYINGLIDEVRVYNRALSASEISRLYQSGLTKINASTVGKLTNGLVGHWSFDGPDMAGVTAFDRSGQGNNGTLTNGPTRAIGKLGQALDFDGSDDYVDVGSGSIYNLNTFTYSIWFKTSNAASQILTSKSKWGNYYGWLVRSGVNNGKILSQIQSATETVNNEITVTYADNAWHHVVLIYDASTNKFDVYFDGVAYPSTTAVNIAYEASANLYIGWTEAGASTPTGVAFNGLIDEVRVYNRALSADEIKRLYNMGR